jgi:hypothetical protein
MPLPRLSSLDTQILVIDLQEKLLSKMPRVPELLRDVGFLLDVSQLLQLPVTATEQYPKGLGPTHPEIARRLTGDVPAKVAFSCCGAPGVLAELRSRNRPNLVLCGMETHVCVLNTALDLLAESFNVFLPVDALSSRYSLDHDLALRRLERSGAILTTVETVAFECLGGADHPQFKAVSKLVIQRMAEV